MTGLEKIIEQINADANETAKSHLAEAEKQASIILDEAKAYVVAELEKQKSSLVETKESLISRAKSSASLEFRKSTLEVKQKLIADTLENAKETLENLETKEYFEVLAKIALNYKGEENLEMSLSQKDLAKVPADFEKMLPSNISLSNKNAKITGGFLLIGNGIDENCSFEALFSDRIEELQDKISSILFN
ncbi:MAG: V-type ATP synthase subunit E family protein [Clostridia bacterium]